MDLDAVRVNASILTGDDVSAIVAPSGTGEFFRADRQPRPPHRGGDGRGGQWQASDRGGRIWAGAGGAAWREAEQAGASAVMMVPPYYGST